ncbi:MAG: F0F1 ATP synthase subunit B [Acholeplasmatales bacterium]|nr:F0F1 ATP synthase subunit B [Acholeplasmatales bacterium]
MLFLSMAENLDAAVRAITEAVTGVNQETGAFQSAGLGPVTMLSDTTMLVSNATQFAVDFGIQICATILLFLAVRFFLWKPITKILETRRDAIDKDLNDAEVAKANAIEIESNAKAELEAARTKVKKMLDDAEKNANIKRDEIINQAKEEARVRMENLDAELEQEKKNMSEQIRKEIVDIAFAAAEKIVAKEIDQTKYLDVVDDILKGVNE